MMPTSLHASSVSAHKPLRQETIMTIIILAVATLTSMSIVTILSIGIIILAFTSAGGTVLIGEPIGAGIHFGATHGILTPTGVILGIPILTIGAIHTGPTIGGITTTIGITRTTTGMVIMEITVDTAEAV